MSSTLDEGARAVPIITSLRDLSDQALQELVNYLTISPPSIPIANVLGYQQFVDTAISNAEFITGLFAQNVSEITITGTTYSGEGSHGPQLTAVPAGKYFVSFGASMQVDSGQDVYAGLEVNSVFPSDDSLSVECENTGNISLARAIPLTLPADSTVNVRYRVTGGTGTARFRWIFALKYGM